MVEKQQQSQRTQKFTQRVHVNRKHNPYTKLTLDLLLTPSRKNSLCSSVSGLRKHTKYTKTQRDSQRYSMTNKIKHDFVVVSVCLSCCMDVFSGPHSRDQWQKCDQHLMQKLWNFSSDSTTNVYMVETQFLIIHELIFLPRKVTHLSCTSWKNPYKNLFRFEGPNWIRMCRSRRALFTFSF